MKKNIVFFHPDLGIGGAERLIIDAAVGLQNRGHRVVIFTSRCDPYHCFEEARDGTLDVRVRGDWIVPATIFSRFSILCAILRQLHLFLSVYFSSELCLIKPDAFVVDQLSAGLPWLAIMQPEIRILFYCHFPDLLLAQGRTALWKRIYRIPFDYLEEWSMSFADSVVVNSAFTKRIVEEVFPNFSKTTNIQIIHPCVKIRENKQRKNKSPGLAWVDKHILLSINRFERKKNIGLAIKAYAGLDQCSRQGVRLIVAGGYDKQVLENLSYHKELEDLSISLGLKTISTRTVLTALNVPHDVEVLFLLSVSDTLKDMLLESARLLIYTPSNEHFGIVPLEAMLAGVPVLAANTGGPLETVVEDKTGWLCPPDDVSLWTEVIYDILHKYSPEDLQKIGENGTKRVKQEFCDAKMSERFEKAILSMINFNRRSTLVLNLFLMGIVVQVFLIICVVLLSVVLSANH